MLPDEANLLKQKKRAEQIKKYLELDTLDPISDIELSRSKGIARVKFPQGCVFLAACTANDIDEIKQYLKTGVNINTTNVDGLTALHQVNENSLFFALIQFKFCYR
jgi:hypothetical protein